MAVLSIQSRGGLGWGPQKQALSEDSRAGDFFRRYSQEKPVKKQAGLEREKG